MSIRLTKILWGAFGTCIALFPAFLMAHYDGPDSGHTAAPVTDNSLGCAASGCHSNSEQGGPINSFGGGISATFSNCLNYTPGGPPITITISASDPVNKHFGFQMTARVASTVNSKNPQQAGTFNPGANPGTANDPMIVLCSDNNFRPVKGCPAAAPYEYIEHYFIDWHQVYTTSQTYTFTWTPPATNVGAVNFYLAGNVVNYDGIQTGADHVYTNNYTLTPVTPQSTPPAIVTGGVLNAASFAKTPAGVGAPVAPGSLVAIFASNFGATQYTAQSAPLALCQAAVTVMFGNTPAAIRDVIPAAGIVNAQVPFEVTPGNVNVTLTANGATSPAMPTTIVAQAPGIFSVPPGLGIALLVNLADYTVAGPTNANIGLPTHPIPRGGTAYMYATGVGAVTPGESDGSADAIEHDAIAKPIVLIGGMQADVLFAGLAAGFPGVYQINLKIPNNAPTGDKIPVQIGSADGSVMSSATVAWISVQ